MKKLSKLFLASILIAPLAGCTGDDGEDDTGNDTTTPTTGVTGDDDGMTGDDDGDDDGMTDDATDGPDDGMTDDADTGTGDTGGPGVTVCQYECAEDADCMIMGADNGFVCGNNDFCLSPCSGDLSCQLFGFTECTTNQECADAFMGFCIDFGDTDFCVAEENPMADCASLMQTAITATDVDGNDVTVCSATPDSTCGDVNGDMLCSFEAPAFDCANCPEAFTCDMAAETCECAATADCEAAMIPGECIDGACIDACEGDADCEGIMNTFDGGGYVCK